MSADPRLSRLKAAGRSSTDIHVRSRSGSADERQTDRETIRQTDAKADYVHTKAAHTHYSIMHACTSCVFYTLTASVSSTKVRKAP